MDPIYVTGHRNPDTDSIVSAMAYAALRNALGDREFVPARLGHVSDETRLVLERFGFEAPPRIKTMRTQVQDLDFDTPPTLNCAVTVNHGWTYLQANPQIPALPVVNSDGTLFGMLSTREIAGYDMKSFDHPYIEDIPLFNLLSVLEGKILNEAGYLVDKISGEVTIAVPQDHPGLLFSRKDSIVLCGQQPDMVRRAIDLGVSCVVICQATLEESLRTMPTETCIISTPFDPYKAARLIYQSVPVSMVCRTEDLISFHLSDFLDDVQDKVIESRYRSYPILDEENKVVGTLSRFHLIRPRRKKVVLVDHNELSQSVPGLEQSEIVEIIDHHRLADIQTSNPIYVRNEPVGSTATIVASMYQERGLMPEPKLAGLIAAAIVADTVMFKSPTCTERDRRMAERMARIAGESLDELGHAIFSASSPTAKTAEELFFSDFKDFHIAGHHFGIAQVTCIDSAKMLERREEFLQIMAQVKEERGFSMMLLMLTDVLLVGSQLVFLGDNEIIEQAFGVQLKDNTCFLPKVLSRKKQIVPALSALWG